MMKKNFLFKWKEILSEIDCRVFTAASGVETLDQLKK